MLTKMESEQRIIRLQKELKRMGIDGALFIYPIDVYYFSGTRQNSTLWIPAAGNPRLFVRKSLTRALQESVIEETRPFPASQEFPSLFGEGVKRIGFTFDVAPVQQYNYYARLLPGREFVDISAINRDLRSVKSDWELERMRHSGAQTCQVFRQVPEFLLVTQNVDGLHRRAGSRDVIELHGNIMRTVCLEHCGFAEDRPDRLPAGKPPRCPRCGSWLRPDVVWFGEALPTDVIRQAYDAAESCDVMLVVGTSALVQPAASLPMIAKTHGAYVVEVNLEPTPLSGFADESHHGKAGEVLPRLLGALARPRSLIPNA